MYFSVGYPLGWFQANADGEELEHKNKLNFQNKSVMLDGLLNSAWLMIDSNKTDDVLVSEINELIAQFNNVPESYNALYVLKHLMELGCVLHVNSNEELFESVKGFKLFRNGLHHCDQNAMQERREWHDMIYHGFEPSRVSGTQLDIWREGDGVQTIEAVFKKFPANIPVSVFLENLFYLKIEGLLFII